MKLLNTIYSQVLILPVATESSGLAWWAWVIIGTAFLVAAFLLWYFFIRIGK